MTATAAAGSAQLPVEMITDAGRLDALVEALVDEPFYAVDTEFHREKSYFPRVALVQIAWSTGIALIDPLSVDLHPLAKILDGPGCAVLHAAQQDLEVMARSCGTVPREMFDTQIAASFLGHATPSLVNLVQGELGLRLPKGDRLTDWLRRPLTNEQCTYAASDGAHLLELRRLLVAQLEAMGRTEWVADECEALRVKPTGPHEPEQAWTRLKDVRTLRGQARGVARSVAAWRERRAAESDMPVRFVLPDLAILGLAQKAPRTLEDLRATRGLDERHGRGPLGESLLAAVRAGVEDKAPVPAERDESDLERHLRPAVTLVSAWVSQLARDEKIDTAILATRSDIVDLLAGSPTARLAIGWRADMVGDGIKRLVAGHAALAFDGRGGLKLLSIDTL